MLHREIVYGAGLGLTSALGVFLFDAFVLKHGWCGHLCPLGAFWSLAGRGAQVRVAFDDASCTRCGDCLKVCPEPRVLNFNEAARHGMVTLRRVHQLRRLHRRVPRIEPAPRPARHRARPVSGRSRTEPSPELPLPDLKE